MNREIKFRGKRIDNGEWVFGSLVNNLWLKNESEKSVCEIIQAHDTNDCWEDYTEDGIYEVNPESVGQFTGLTNKNGKEIYEGDIVKDRFDTYTIIFSAASFFMKIHGEHQKGKSKHGCYNVSTGVEIIGNIYENPELLK